MAVERTVSKKWYSWVFDGHFSPKNKRLQENWEEMKQKVIRMCKLIGENEDSLAKKAEMCYQKKPELKDLVVEFFQMYRSLAGRYDHVLGAGGNVTDLSNEDGDETSTLDSESESDDSSVKSFAPTQSSDDDQGLRLRIIELRDVKEKLQMAREEISEGFDEGSKNDKSEILPARIAVYEKELKIAREKIRASEEQISILQDELQKYKLMDFSNIVQGEVDTVQGGTSIMETSSKVDKQVAVVRELNVGSDAVVDSELKIQALEEELKLTKDKLLDSEKEVARLNLELQSKKSSVPRLQNELGVGSVREEISAWEVKIEKEKSEVLKLQNRIVPYKSNLSDRDQEIRGLRGISPISNANKSLSEENSELQAEIARLLKEKTYLEENLKAMDVRCQSLDEDVRRIKVGKTEMEAMLRAEIEELKSGTAEKNDDIEELNRRLDSLKLNYDTLKANNDAKNVTYAAEIRSRDIHINEMSTRLFQLRMEQVGRTAKAELADKQVEGLRSKVKELERAVMRQHELILELMEEKREAIRQPCFSLEHYRNGYHWLRQAVIGQKPVMAS